MDCPISNRCNRYGSVTCSESFPYVNCFLKNKILSTFKESGLPLRYYDEIHLRCNRSHVDFEAYQQLHSIQQKVNEFAYQGKAVFIYSRNKGNGKSSWACKLLREFIIRFFVQNPEEHPPLFIDMRRFFSEFHPKSWSQTDYVQKIIRDVYDSPLVVWDDIFFNYQEDIEKINWLSSVIETRILNLKSNIYTSNTNPRQEGLEDVLGSALYSRVLRTCEMVEFNGADRRCSIK